MHKVTKVLRIWDYFNIVYLVAIRLLIYQISEIESNDEAQ
jgi:hypothetical protein